MLGTPLPTDVGTLQSLVSSQQAQIEHLNLVIAKLRRMQFGRRSEQLDETLEQLELALALEELEAANAERPIKGKAKPKYPKAPGRLANPYRSTCPVNRCSWRRPTPAAPTAAVL